MATNIIRLTGLATAVVALGACGSKTSEAQQRDAIVARNVNSCVQGFEQRRSQTPGVTPAGLDARRFCDCAVTKMAEGKSADDLHAMENDHALTPSTGRIVSACLDQEARRAGVIEEDAAPAPFNRSAGSTTQNSSATTPPAAPTPPRAADRPVPPRTPPAAPRPRSSDPIATPVSPPRTATPTPAPSAPRPATPPAATPRPSGPTSLLPRTMTPPAPPRTPSTRPPPEG